MMGTVHMTEATDCHPWQPERGMWVSGGRRTPGETLAVN